MICKSDRAKRNFIKKFAEEIDDEKAAIFAGAGLSIPAGAVSWKELLREEAKAIEIDVDRESDLVTIAQYIYNETRSRSKISNLIKNHITKKGTITDNHKILSSLPIKTYWTTNYDDNIERSFEERDKTVDIKKSVRDLSSEVKNADATIYKMHGDISQVHDAVLIKDDYEIYDRKNELFTQTLRGDLITKTLLFIGFSFDDPNFDSILSKVRVMLEGNTRTHYCFFKKVDINDEDFDKFEGEEREREFKYAENKQYLKIKDLERYGIKTILVNSYEEITEILKAIRQHYISNNIFISGSYEKNDEFKIGGSDTQSFISSLAKMLHMEGFKITSGYGSNVGSSVITGVLEGSEKTKERKLDEILRLKPFPHNISSEEERKKLFTSYRKDMLKDCGIAIFLLGNKYNDKDEIVSANGLKEEFNIAKSMGAALIPIGGTGYVSKELHQQVLNNFEEYYPNGNNEMKNTFIELGDTDKEEKDILESIVKFIRLLELYRLNNLFKYRRL